MTNLPTVISTRGFKCPEPAIINQTRAASVHFKVYQNSECRLYMRAGLGEVVAIPSTRFEEPGDWIVITSPGQPSHRIDISTYDVRNGCYIAIPAFGIVICTLTDPSKLKDDEFIFSCLGKETNPRDAIVRLSYIVHENNCNPCFYLTGNKKLIIVKAEVDKTRDPGLYMYSDDTLEHTLMDYHPLNTLFSSKGAMRGCVFRTLKEAELEMYRGADKLGELEELHSELEKTTAAQLRELSQRGKTIGALKKELEIKEQKLRELTDERAQALEERNAERHKTDEARKSWDIRKTVWGFFGSVLESAMLLVPLILKYFTRA